MPLRNPVATEKKGKPTPKLTTPSVDNWDLVYTIKFRIDLNDVLEYGQDVQAALDGLRGVGSAEITGTTVEPKVVSE